MEKRRKNWAILLVLIMVGTLLGGCAQGKGKKESSIFTGSPEALRVFVRGNSTYADKLVEQFPDIEFDFYHYGGLNATAMMNQLLEQEDLGDLCFSSLQVSEDIAEKHLLNLSGYAICSRYEPSILSQLDVAGNIYQLPGYVSMRDIIYNKDMFEKYGWEEPQNFKELISLCSQIREENSEITPIVMAGAAGGYYFTTMTSYAQAEFLYKPEGRKWTEAYQKGEAYAEEGFGSGIRMMQELIDAGAFDYDKNVGLWDKELFQQRMLTGEAAMMFVWGGQTMIAQEIETHPEIHFGVMPFRNRDGQAFIGTNIPYYICLGKELGEKGNEKKLEDALRILDWLSTEEGISALSTDTLAAIFPLKNAENIGVLEIYQEFWNKNLNSIKAPMLYAGYEDILVPVADKIMEAVQGKGRLDKLSGYIDELHQEYLKSGIKAIEAGCFSRDFTHAETVQLFAHVLYSMGDSDIALVSDGSYQNGVINLGGVYARLLEGSVTEDQVTCSLPGSGITDPAVQMTLTGRQVKDLLENGKYMEDKEASASFAYYWAGMEVKWRKEKVVSVTLEDGTVLEDNQTCTVTFADKDYAEETELLGSPKALSYTVKEAFQQYLEKNSPVSPVPVLR